MIRRPPRSTRTDTLLPYTTLFRSVQNVGAYLGSLLQRTFRMYAYEPNAWFGDWTLFYWGRSEEHTSELQSLMRISYAVFCLKKKKEIKSKAHKQHTKNKSSNNTKTMQHIRLTYTHTKPHTTSTESMNINKTLRK